MKIAINRLSTVIVLIILAVAPSVCAGLKVGTGQTFIQATNPEPDKMAMVYFFRKDGSFTSGFSDFPPYLITKSASVVPDQQVPVTILANKTYRPMLFDPGEITFAVKAGGSHTLTLKPGETRCIEASRVFRGVAVVGVDEVPIDKCYEQMHGLELAMTLTQLRKRNGATPLQQVGFKDLDLDPSAAPSK
jgi:hypothetical protein